MKNLRRLSKISPVLGLFLIGIILTLLLTTPSLADVGVRPILPGGSSLQPEAETPIQMADEVVTISVRPATEADNSIIQLNPAAYGLQFQPIWYSYIADVQADFSMRNPTNQAVNLLAWFPLASALEKVSWEINPDETVPRIASFKVLVDGNPIDYTVSELPNPKGTDKPLLPWASFPVSFPAGKDTRIQVSYLFPLQPAVKGSELALYYIFQTGAGWAGPIGQAELILNLPYPASAETLARMDARHPWPAMILRQIRMPICQWMESWKASRHIGPGRILSLVHRTISPSGWWIPLSTSSCKQPVQLSSPIRRMDRPGWSWHPFTGI